MCHALVSVQSSPADFLLPTTSHKQTNILTRTNPIDPDIYKGGTTLQISIPTDIALPSDAHHSPLVPPDGPGAGVLYHTSLYKQAYFYSHIDCCGTLIIFIKLILHCKSYYLSACMNIQHNLLLTLGVPTRLLW